MTNKPCAIGIDLGGTNIKGILVDDAGTIMEKTEKATEDKTSETGEVWKTAIREMVTELARSAGSRLRAVGLAAPGIADASNESITCMPDRLQGLENFHWEKFLNMNQVPVRVINDAQAALMAESTFGSAKGYRHVVLLTLGTGVGGGILIDGKLYQGHFQRAGHVGHISLNTEGNMDITNIPGSLEDAIGNATLADRSAGRFDTTTDLLKACREGDHHANQIWLDSVRKLAIGICSLINVVAPEIVILGGGITKAGDQLFRPLQQFMDLYEWRPAGVTTPVLQATYLELAGAIGAAGFALTAPHS